MDLVPKPQTTADRLANVLEGKGHGVLAERARQGTYDDFRSPLAFPQATLIKDLLGVGDKELARRVQDGEFDSTREEAQAWLQSDEGLETLKELDR